MDKPPPDEEATQLEGPLQIAAELHAVFEIGRALRPLTAEARARVLAKVRAKMCPSPSRRGN